MADLQRRSVTCVLFPFRQAHHLVYAITTTTCLWQHVLCYVWHIPTPADVQVPEELVVYDDIEDIFTYGSLQVRLETVCWQIAALQYG